MSNPTADWHRLGDAFFTKTRLYDAVFDSDLELENMIIVGAPYAGAVDQTKIQTHRHSRPSQMSVDLYTCSGYKIQRIKWEQNLIKGLGWADDEMLVIISEDGSVRCHRNFREDFNQFTLGPEAGRFGVRACRFWSAGFVALLNDNSLVAVSNYEEPRPRKLAALPTGVIHSWTVIAPANSLSRSVEAFVAVDQTVYVVDTNEVEDRLLPNGPFQHIVASPNGLYLALFAEKGGIWVITSDFQRKVGEFESPTKTLPKDIKWCGNDGLLLAWEDEVHLFSLEGSHVKFYYDDWVHIVSDIDGVRLLTNDTSEFLQKVPEISDAIFRFGSTSPASVLFDAAQQLEEGLPRADENIQLIRDHLSEAVDSCVEASGQQYHIKWQKCLLKAASLGKSVLDLYSSDYFVEMCRDLRIMNAVRDHTIGLPLTYRQFRELSPEKLLLRLMNRRQYQLSIHIANIIMYPTHHIYAHWASYTIRASKAPDSVIGRTIVDKLRHKRGISFETIARTAFEEGRKGLATILLSHESLAGKQVPLLMSMSEDELALDKAIASGDTDLVYYVLLHIKKALPLASFLQTVSGRPAASALIESSARLQDQTLLRDYFHQDDRRLDQSCLLFEEALAQALPQGKLDKIKLSANCLGESGKDAFVTQMLRTMQDTQKLLAIQSSMDRDRVVSEQRDSIGRSLDDTIFDLLLHAQYKKAQKLSQDFRFTSRAFEWMRLRALVAARNWRDLEDHIDKSKRSSISWEAYYDEILGAGNTRLAGKMVHKCTHLSARQRSEMLVKCGMLQAAGEELARVKDVEGLEELTQRTGSKPELAQIMADLKSKRRNT